MKPGVRFERSSSSNFVHRGAMYDHTERPERTEARAIMRLVFLGTTTLKDARELISIPERQEQALRTFVAIAGKDGASVRSALAFRHRVMTEFEKLVAVGDELPRGV
jgi:hypothetical protein